jgi:hypothetical protein
MIKHEHEEQQQQPPRQSHETTRIMCKISKDKKIFISPMGIARICDEILRENKCRKTN